MQFPPFPRYLVPSRSKYSPQHHVLKHPLYFSVKNIKDDHSKRLEVLRFIRAYWLVISSILISSFIISCSYIPAYSFYDKELRRISQQRRKPLKKQFMCFTYIKWKKYFILKFFHIKHSNIIDKETHNFTLWIMFLSVLHLEFPALSSSGTCM